MPMAGRGQRPKAVVRPQPPPSHDARGSGSQQAFPLRDRKVREHARRQSRMVERALLGLAGGFACLTTHTVAAFLCPLRPASRWPSERGPRARARAQQHRSSFPGGIISRRGNKEPPRFSLPSGVQAMWAASSTTYAACICPPQKGAQPCPAHTHVRPGLPLYACCNSCLRFRRIRP